jgi:hypothetical protein
MEIVEQVHHKKNTPMNNFTSPYNLPFLSELKSQREKMINNLINNLKIGDVKDDKKFEQTTLRVKRQILLTPVQIGEPKFTDYEYEERQLSMQQQLVGVGGRHHYIHKISFPFTGDSELFSHIPENGFTYSSSDHGLILPDSNAIEVEVDLPELNPQKAIAEARNLLSMTLQFVNSNNATIQTWSVAVGQRIDEQLKQKRAELIKLFP